MGLALPEQLIIYGEQMRARAGIPAGARLIVDDFLAGCPDLVAVDDRDGLDYLRILATADARFAPAWSGYRQVAALDGVRLFGRRRDARCPARATTDCVHQ